MFGPGPLCALFSPGYLRQALPVHCCEPLAIGVIRREGSEDLTPPSPTGAFGVMVVLGLTAPTLTSSSST